MMSKDRAAVEQRRTKETEIIASVNLVKKNTFTKSIRSGNFQVLGFYFFINVLF